MSDVNRKVLEVLGSVGLDLSAVRLEAVGDELLCNSPHRLELAASVAVAAEGSAAADFWHKRGGSVQKVSIDRRTSVHALATGLLLSIDGHDLRIANGARAAVSDFYQSGDGRWVHPMGTYPGLRDGMLDLLDCANSPRAIAKAISGWKATELEDEIAARNLAGAMVRTIAEWRAHPQGRALSQTPLIEIERTGEAPPRQLRFDARPLGGLRVLDFSHVIAGPVLARTLASHGAQVLRIGSPRWADPMEFILDTGWGKRSAYLDLDQPDNVCRLRRLLDRADVFIESWRPSSLSRFGLAPDTLATRYPGLVSVSVSAFGRAGPWSGRKGFEQLAQAVSGISQAEGGSDRPRYVQTGLLVDYLAGYFGAIGAIAALVRQRSIGGTYHVHVSLTRLAMWVQDLGLVKPRIGQVLPKIELTERETPFGRLKHLPPRARLSKTPARWDLPPCPAGAFQPEWI